MNPRALATLGIGYGALAIASLGFLPAQEIVPVPVEVRQHVPNGGGGSSSDAGTGWVKKDHGWVRATKYAKVNGRTYDLTALSSAKAYGSMPLSKASGFGHNLSASRCAVSINRIDTAITFCYDLSSSSAQALEFTIASTSGRSREMKVEVIGADEIAAIIEEMT